MARHNYERAVRVQQWPVRELLIAYLEILKEQLREDLQHRQLLFQIRTVWGGAGSQAQPPQIPTLLREPES